MIFSEGKAKEQTKNAQERLKTVQTILKKGDQAIDLWKEITPDLVVPEKPLAPALKLPREPIFDRSVSKPPPYTEQEPKKDDPKYWQDLKNNYKGRIWWGIVALVVVIFLLLAG